MYAVSDNEASILVYYLESSSSITVNYQTNTKRLYLHFKSICSAIFLSHDLYHGWIFKSSFRDKDDKEILLLLLLVADNKETFAVSESQMEWLLGISISGGGVGGRDLSMNLPGDKGTFSSFVELFESADEFLVTIE